MECSSGYTMAGRWNNEVAVKIVVLSLPILILNLIISFYENLINN